MSKRWTRLAFGAACAAALALALPGLRGRAHSCVGMTVVIGYWDTPEQAAAARILSTLIVERTGTATELQPKDDYEEVYGALVRDDIGIALLPRGFGLRTLEGDGVALPAGAPDDVWEFARTRFSLDKRLVWLGAFAFDAPSATGDAGGAASPVAPVMRKDVIDKFPAMPRLVEKLKGRIRPEDLGPMTGGKLDNRRMRKAALAYLEGERLI